MSSFSTDPGHQNNNLHYQSQANFIYLLQALGFLLGGITFVIAVILNYINRKHVKNTWLESHYNWQIKTFWVALVLLVIGTITLPLLIGYVVLIAATIWTIHRIVYGWIALKKNSEVKPFF